MSNFTNLDFTAASGRIPYTMTNDAMFHIVLQNDPEALKRLIAALLHTAYEDIVSVEIRNPIQIGDTVTDKTSVLDLLVLFNDHTLINLEMQVQHLENWIPRSIYYLCKVYTSLEHGEDYESIKSAIHIGFLDRTLIPGRHEFYATYRLKNVRDGYEYSDKLTLSVVQLNHIDMATDEDKLHQIDRWASLFKATTWEEIKMLVQENPNLTSAAQSIYDSNQDPLVLEMCRRRQEELALEEYHRKKVVELTELTASLTEQLANRDKQLADSNKKLANRDKQLADSKSIISKQNTEIESLKALLSAKGLLP